MGSNFANPDSLTELSALVERTLLDTGRLFRKNGSMPVSTHLQRSIPSYFDSFQDALDNLSEQIFIAKAFLEKDYDAIKAREVAAEPEDVVMSDADEKGAESQPSSAEQPVQIEQPVKVEPKAEEDALAEVAQPTEVVPEARPGKEVPVKQEKDSGNDASADPGFPGAHEGVNFNSVLGGDGASSFDLNLDFGNDDMGDQAFLSGTFGNANETNADKVATSAPEEDSINAPAGGDAFDLELQNTGMGSNPFPDQGTGDDIMGPGESSFDDLFMETENLGEDGTGDLNQLEGGSLMNLNELDDNWFS
ncbi:hypothetical protein N7523_004898 [Penicillium sp. IBT 18751x]|nr:hypothetical protein N7523_004898 [Penicillium sp. IBT 18751x]